MPVSHLLSSSFGSTVNNFMVSPEHGLENPCNFTPVVPALKESNAEAMSDLKLDALFSALRAY